MSIAQRLLQCIENAAFDPVIGVRTDACPGCDLIGDLKSDSVNILRQPIWIGPKDLVNLTPVPLINLRRQIHGNPEFLKEDHGLAHVLPFSHLGCDLHGPFHTDALDLCQTLRLLLHDPKGIVAEFLNDPCRQRSSNTLDGTGCQIPLDGRRISRHLPLVALHHQLLAIERVIFLCTGDFQILALRHMGKCADHRIFFSLVCKLHHRVSIFLIAIHNVLHISRQCAHGFFFLHASIYRFFPINTSVLFSESGVYQKSCHGHTTAKRQPSPIATLPWVSSSSLDSPARLFRCHTPMIALVQAQCDMVPWLISFLRTR